LRCERRRNLDALIYDSYGNVTSGLVSTRYTYTGRESDPETGLIYYRAQWYDAGQGRFISEDPFGLKGGVNLFGYVANNPLRFSDPGGLCPQNSRQTSHVIPAGLGFNVGKSATIVSWAVTAGWVDQPCRPTTKRCDF